MTLADGQREIDLERLSELQLDVLDAYEPEALQLGLHGVDARPQRGEPVDAAVVGDGRRDADERGAGRFNGDARHGPRTSL